MSQEMKSSAASAGVELLWPGSITKQDAEWLAQVGLSRDLVGRAMDRTAHTVPLLVDRRMRPLPYWSEFFSSAAESRNAYSLRQYAYDARRLADFFASRKTNVVAATQEDLVAYRKDRTEPAEGKPVAAATWNREKALIILMYRFLIQRGVLKREPWIKLGKRSPIDYPGVPGSPAIRFLTHEQWKAFRDVGLRGQLPEGAMDPSWRVAHPQRNVVGASLALATGMRLREFSSVFDFEVPLLADRSASFDIEATAKYSKRRTVSVPPETLREIHLYRRTERANLIRSTSSAREAQRDKLALVHRIDRVQRKITATFLGREHVWDIAAIPTHLRRLCVTESADGLEPMSLFIGSNGLAVQARTWSSVFEAASRRIDSFRDASSMPSMPAKVVAHDLRHTFAVVLLRLLMVLASQREAARRAGEIGMGSMSDHIVHNPILTVQRVLGHSSPLTTMTYLRYVDNTEEIVRRALDTWADTELTYADYISDLFTKGIEH